MKKMASFLFTIMALALFSWAGGREALAEEPGEKVKIACVGDSITYGDMSTDPARYSYPSQLQSMLGEGYEVQNFGVNGNTLTQSSWCDKYLNTDRSRECQEWEPDVIIVMLGTNDSQDICWIDTNGKEQYEEDLKELIDVYQQLPSEPEIYIATSPTAQEDNQYGIRPQVIEKEIVPLQKGIAEEMGCRVIDVHEQTADFWEKGLLTKTYNQKPDGVHPNNEGYLQLAKLIYNGIAEQFGLAKTDVSSYELDCNNERIAYHGEWGDWYDTALYMDTEKFTTAPGSYAELTFEGVGIQVTGLQTPGLSYMDVYLDGELYQSVDTYAPEARKHVSLFAIDSLPYGTHTVRLALSNRVDSHHAYEAKISLDSVKVFEKSQGFADRILFESETGEYTLQGSEDQLQVNIRVLPEEANQKLEYKIYPEGAATITDTGLVTAQAPEGKFVVTAMAQDGSYRMASQEFTIQSGDGSYEWADDQSGLVSYTGSWVDAKDEWSYDGTIKETHTPGDGAQITFQGTGISVVGKLRYSGEYSYADVFLDGELVGRASFTHIQDGKWDLVRKTVYKIDGLEPGTHTLRLVAKSNESGTPNEGQCGLALDGFGIYQESGCDLQELERAVFEARVLQKNGMLSESLKKELEDGILRAIEMKKSAKSQEEADAAASSLRERIAKAAKTLGESGQKASLTVEEPAYGKISLTDAKGQEIVSDSVACGSRITVRIAPDKNAQVTSLSVNGLKKRVSQKKNTVIIQELTVTQDMVIQAETEFPKIRIACVGDSITYGSCSTDPEGKSYPAMLHEMLGDSCIVKNFSMPGACAGSDSNYPYSSHSVYQESLAFMPDIVILMLGTNDAAYQNWQGSEYFKEEMIKLADAYQNLPSSPTVHLATPLYTYDGSRQATIEEEAAPAIRKLAEQTGHPLIDINQKTQKLDSSFYADDGLHLNDEGYEFLATLMLQDLHVPSYLKLADKGELYVLCSRFEELEESQISQGDWNQLETALARAKEILADSGAEQREVFLAARDLQAAYQALTFTDKIKVACVGDSITYGHGSTNPATDSYPAHLQELLGSQYEVVNFGVSGKALNQNKGYESYISTWEYGESKNFNPDVVILMLGTNDAKDKNWDGREAFMESARALISEYQNLPSKPVVYLGISPLVADDEEMRQLDEPADNYIWNSRLVNEIAPLQRQIGEEMGCRIIDIQNKTAQLEELDRYLSWDLIHPHDEGYELLASWMYEGVLPQFSAFKGDLQESVGRAKALNLETYTARSAENFRECLKKAEELLEKEGTQAEMAGEVTEARRLLEKSMEELEKRADTSKLKALAEEVEKLDVSVYTKESVSVLQAALQRAKVLLQDENLAAEDQEVVEAAIWQLKDAKEKLVKREIPDVQEPQTEPGNKQESPQTPKPLQNEQTAQSTKKPAKAPKIPKIKIKKIRKRNKSSVRIYWNKAKQVSGYEIQVSRKKKKGFKTVVKAKGKQKAAVVKKLKRKKTYYFRVRAYKKVNKKIYRGKWSKTVSFKLK